MVLTSHSRISLTFDNTSFNTLVIGGAKGLIEYR